MELVGRKVGVKLTQSIKSISKHVTNFRLAGFRQPASPTSFLNFDTRGVNLAVALLGI